MEKLNNKKGFTLIELLVVIAVIGVLSGVIMQALQSARQKSRDTTRKAALEELQKAITHYYTTNGSYPTTGGAWWSSEVGDTCNGGCSYQATYIPGIVAQNMIPSLPKDPLGGINLSGVCAGTQYRAFVYKSDSKHYKLISNCSLENIAYPTAGQKFYDVRRIGTALQVTDDLAATSVAGW